MFKELATRRGRLLLAASLALCVATGGVVVAASPPPEVCPVPGTVCEPGGVLHAPQRVLVYSATYGYKHTVIPKANGLIKAMGMSTGQYLADITENPEDISAENLKNYDALVFNHTSGKAPSMTDQQRAEMMRWVYCGGGFVGLGEAEDSNYAWPEFQELIGANPVAHGLSEGEYNARLVVEDSASPVMARVFGGVKSVRLADEVYWHRMDPRRLRNVQVLMSLDVADLPKTSTDVAPAGGDVTTSGKNHIWPHQPVTWTSRFRGGGRSFATTLGHGDVAWDTPWFRAMVYEGIRFVAHSPNPSCLASTRPLPPAAGPPPANPRQVGKTCPMPTSGPYLPLLSRLTPQGVTALMPTSPLFGLGGKPFYIFAPSRRYVLDLSKVKARTADVDVKLDWQAVADYDLGITLPWGFAGTHNLQPAAANGERVILRNVPTCTDFMVAAENFWSAQDASPQLQAKLTIKVTPRT